MRKILLLVLACTFFLKVSGQTHLKYLDYVFPNDSIAGFDEKSANQAILSHYFFGIEYKVMMYKMKRDFINAKYGLNLNILNLDNFKGTPSSVQGLPCNNEDFEASASSTSTVVGTGSVGNTLLGWTVTMGQNTGVNGSCVQSGCCPTLGANDAWVRSTPWTDPGILGVIPASPLGGTKILQMNNNITNQGEIVRIQQTFPVTSSNALFQFSYMAAMDGSGHACCDQPFMTVKIIDCMNNLLACPQVSITPPGPSCATVTATGWITNTLNISYTPSWITKSIDLTPYLNTCITIQITVGDCDGWAHYGMAYVDCICKPMTVGVNTLTFPAGTSLIAVAACGVATASLQAPAGMGPYLWNGPTGSGVTSNTNQAVNTTMAGNYTLTMNPPGICAPITKTLSLTFSSYPNGGFTRANTCTTYTLTNTGSASPAVQTYSFAGPGAPSSFTTTSGTSVVNFAPSSTYTITQTVTNAAGCYTTTSQVITTPAGPSPAYSAVPSMTQCITGNAFTFNATTSTGTHTYNFSPSAGAPPAGYTANYGSVSFTAPGTYTVTHTVNSGGCVTATSSVVVVSPTPTISVASGSAPACAGQQATLTASGGPGALTWTGPSSYTAVGGGTTTINNFQTTGQGIYTLTANNNGCIVTRTVNLTMPAQPTATVTNSGPYCPGDTIRLNAVTSSTAISWTYFWAGFAGFWNCCSATSASVTTPATTSSSGNYFFYVSFTNGCWAQVQTSVTVNPCVLPVELTSFTSVCNGKQNNLEWQTASEKKCKYFNVWRSIDGKNYMLVAKMNAHGTSYEKHNYQWTDEAVIPGVIYYYKLTEADEDASEKDIGNVITSRCESNSEDVNVYPVPSDKEIYLVSGSNIDQASIQILDALGNQVKEIKSVSLLRNNILKISTAELINGYYEIVLSNEARIIRKKVIIFR